MLPFPLHNQKLTLPVKTYDGSWQAGLAPDRLVRSEGKVEATLQVAPNKALFMTRVKTLNVNISSPSRAKAKLTADLKSQLKGLYCIVDSRLGTPYVGSVKSHLFSQRSIRWMGAFYAHSVKRRFGEQALWWKGASMKRLFTIIFFVMVLVVLL
jgi:hypothetical protein